MINNLLDWMTTKIQIIQIHLKTLNPNIISRDCYKDKTFLGWYKSCRIELKKLYF